MNGVYKLKQELFSNVTKVDLLQAMMVDLGVSVSNIPKDYQSKSYTENAEVFIPERVTKRDELPEFWKMVFDLHNEPRRKDCVRFGYRYVHLPYEIIPRYPRVPCKGIFCISDSTVDLTKLTADDLIHIGNEFEED